MGLALGFDDAVDGDLRQVMLLGEDTDAVGAVGGAVVFVPDAQIAQRPPQGVIARQIDIPPAEVGGDAVHHFAGQGAGLGHGQAPGGEGMQGGLDHPSQGALVAFRGDDGAVATGGVGHGVTGRW